MEKSKALVPGTFGSSTFPARKDLQLAESSHSCPGTAAAGNAVGAHSNAGVLTRHENQPSAGLESAESSFSSFSILLLAN